MRQKAKLFFNKLGNFLKGVKCPECGYRWVRNHSHATKTTKVVYVCARDGHVFGGKK